MRVISVALGVLVMVLGAGFLWAGFVIAFDRSPDSDRGVMAIGAVFGLTGLLLTCAAVGTMVQALDYVLPRWVPVCIAVLGLLPYPVLIGPLAVVFNLLLLGVAALLMWARQGARAGFMAPVTVRR